MSSLHGVLNCLSFLHLLSLTSRAITTSECGLDYTDQDAGPDSMSYHSQRLVRQPDVFVVILQQRRRVICEWDLDHYDARANGEINAVEENAEASNDDEQYPNDDRLLIIERSLWQYADR